MAETLDLSADIGEGYGVYPAPMQLWRAEMHRGGEIVPSEVEFPPPRRIMNLVSSVSLACGLPQVTLPAWRRSPRSGRVGWDTGCTPR
jgi:hypothetical protein